MTFDSCQAYFDKKITIQIRKLKIQHDHVIQNYFTYQKSQKLVEKKNLHIYEVNTKLSSSVAS